MSTWQEKAREALARALRPFTVDGIPCPKSDERITAMLAALAPVVEAEVRRGQAEALRAASDEEKAWRQHYDAGPTGLASRHASIAAEDRIRGRADAIEAGDPR